MATESTNRKPWFMMSLKQVSDEEWPVAAPTKSSTQHRVGAVAAHNYAARGRMDQQPPSGGGIHICVLTGQVAIQYKEQPEE
jgi:hypothetical protein